MLGRPLFESGTPTKQLEEICRVLGSPSIERWPEVERLPNYSGVAGRFERIDLQEIFPMMSHDETHLVEVMLQLNPKNRISAKAALQHDFFGGFLN